MDQENVTSSEDHLKNEETTEAPSNSSEVVEEAGSIPSICPWQVRCLTLKRSGKHLHFTIPLISACHGDVAQLEAGLAAPPSRQI